MSNGPDFLTKRITTIYRAKTKDDELTLIVLNFTFTSSAG